jgi:excisionase family DNA binding protein
VNPELEPLLSVKEVARLLNIHPRSVSRLIASGELPSVKFGDYQKSTRRVRPAALRNFIARKESGE